VPWGTSRLQTTLLHMSCAIGCVHDMKGSEENHREYAIPGGCDYRGVECRLRTSFENGGLHVSIAVCCRFRCAYLHWYARSGCAENKRVFLSGNDFLTHSLIHSRGSHSSVRRAVKKQHGTCVHRERERYVRILSGNVPKCRRATHCVWHYRGLSVDLDLSSETESLHVSITVCCRFQWPDISIATRQLRGKTDKRMVRSMSSSGKCFISSRMSASAVNRTAKAPRNYDCCHIHRQF